MELYLIRHGQSLNNAIPEENRVEDAPLTEVGYRQAALLADWIAVVGLTRLITSPFLRALDTTLPISRATSLTPEVWLDLHEQGGCVAGPTPEVMQGRPGMTRQQIQEYFPGFIVGDDIDGDGWWQSRPYETMEQAQARADRMAQITRDKFARTNERVAYVMHATFKMLLVESLTGQSVDVVNNSAVTKIVITERDSHLEYSNHLDHLSNDLIT